MHGEACVHLCCSSPLGHVGSEIYKIQLRQALHTDICMNINRPCPLTIPALFTHSYSSSLILSFSSLFLCTPSSHLTSLSCLSFRFRYSRNEDDTTRGRPEGVSDFQDFCGQSHRPDLRSRQRDAPREGGSWFMSCPPRCYKLHKMDSLTFSEVSCGLLKLYQHHLSQGCRNKKRGIYCSHSPTGCIIKLFEVRPSKV